MRHFSFRIDKIEAQEITIETAIKDTPEGMEMQGFLTKPVNVRLFQVTLN